MTTLECYRFDLISGVVWVKSANLKLSDIAKKNKKMAPTYRQSHLYSESN